MLKGSYRPVGGHGCVQLHRGEFLGTGAGEPIHVTAPVECQGALFANQHTSEWRKYDQTIKASS